MKVQFLATLAAIAVSATGWASAPEGDLIIKLKPGKTALMQKMQILTAGGGKLEQLNERGWVHLKMSPTALQTMSAQNVMAQLASNPAVESVQPNFLIRIPTVPGLESRQAKRVAQAILEGRVAPELLPQNFFGTMGSFGDAAQPGAPKPEIPTAPPIQKGSDPLANKQWGMTNIHATEAWNTTKGSKKITVAVIDTGVDYTHEDLVQNLWRNPGEVAGDGKDNDGNGYVDDMIGWDFAANDNKPFDEAGNLFEIILQGKNPGHGTHCAGNVGATGDNSKGILGVSPVVNIMALKFITVDGQGTTADAIKAIDYAVKNGARVLSNSWGSEGDDPNDPNTALKDSITNAEKHGVLFVAAAGNGHQGVGYDNDTDAKPGVPASYDIKNIVSVAAIDVNNALGSFSNWGRRTVHVAAPGVKVFSTTVNSTYNDMVIDLPGIIQAGWDGTSMATPHVAGAAALVLAVHPELSVYELKDRLLNTVEKIPAMTGKSVSEGKINVAAAIR